MKEALNALEEVKQTINKAYEEGYRIGYEFGTSQQRTWVGLQSHEITELVDEVDWYNFPMDLVRASEAKLRSKNEY